MISGIDHLGLTVRDAEASADWYVSVLGFTRVGNYEAPDGSRKKVFLQHSAFDVRIGLVEHASSTRSVFDETSAGLDHLAFTVGSAEELDDWRERLAGSGVVVSPVAPAHSLPRTRIVVFRDPDNIQLELVSAAS